MNKIYPKRAQFMKKCKQLRLKKAAKNLDIEVISVTSQDLANIEQQSVSKPELILVKFTKHRFTKIIILLLLLIVLIVLITVILVLCLLVSTYIEENYFPNESFNLSKTFNSSNFTNMLKFTITSNY